MFEKELMILGLRRQQNLLNELIRLLEEKANLDYSDCYLYGERTRQVASNLKKLRKIKRDYCRYQESLAFPQ